MTISVPEGFFTFGTTRTTIDPDYHYRLVQHLSIVAAFSVGNKEQSDNIDIRGRSAFIMLHELLERCFTYKVFSGYRSVADDGYTYAKIDAFITT